MNGSINQSINLLMLYFRNEPIKHEIDNKT